MASTPGSSGVSADRGASGTNPRAGSWCSRAFFAASPVYPIVDASLFGDGDPGPVLRALGAAGIRLVQLRGKGMPSGAFVSWVGAGVRAASGRGVRVLVNDRADVALLAGADGVHLGQHDLSARAARRLLGARAVIGLSTHTCEEMRAARREPVDYLAVGPVFETPTKADSAPVVSLKGVRQARRLYEGPLVAIGGISQSRISQSRISQSRISQSRIRAVLAAGADAAAMISAVSGSSPGEIAGRARALLAEAAGQPPPAETGRVTSSTSRRGEH